MNKTNIEWCNMTWNPVTGCLHGCEYCYARRFAQRFSGFSTYDKKECLSMNTEHGQIHELNKPCIKMNGKPAPYPFCFSPTFHKYRLDEPAQKKKPQNIFVCSMADLFGAWVPDKWIKKVFEACNAASQHRYLFLTKNPERYYQLWDDINICIPNNFWLGATITNSEDRYFYSLNQQQNSFLSIEPLHENLEGFDDIPSHRFPDWCIISAETGNRKNKIIPERKWIENIVNECRQRNVPVFMKSSLQEIWGEELIQEYPWGN